jgi:endonuclease/exonuclease/phosphatase (EEP) superfamily protein YafD
MSGRSTRGRRPRSDLRSWAWTIALAALPWCWFLVRDLVAQMDLVAFFLPALVILAVVAVVAVAVIRRRARLALVVASLVAFGAVVVLGPRAPLSRPAPTDPFRLVAVNAYESNPTPRAAVDDLLAERPDVLAVVEYRADLIGLLEQRFPYHSGPRRPGLFSVWPVVTLSTPPSLLGDRVLRVRIERPGAPFVLYAVHLPNPIGGDTSFGAHLATIDAFVAAARSEELPVIVAGDFNTSDRTQGYRSLAASFEDAMRAGWASSTYVHGPWWPLQLRIDHVFTGSGWCSAGAHTLGVSGSDHDAVSVLLGPCGG